MRTKSTEHFRRGILRIPLGPQPRRGVVGSGAEQTSRHLRWTLAITDRLTRRVTWRGIHPENMLLALAARSWIYSRQVALGHPHFFTSVLHIQTGDHAKLSADRGSRNWRLSMPRTESASLITLSPPLHSSAPLASRSVARVCTVTHTVTELLQKSMRSEKTNPTPLTSASAYPKARPLGVSAAGFIDDIGELSARVQRRHRRLQQEGFPNLGIVGEQEQAVRKAPQAEVIEKKRPRLARTKNLFPDEPMSRSHRPRPEPPMDIGQITDAVLQQLDRRLVSARERMGRI
jgi:hypothetical protein